MARKKIPEKEKLKLWVRAGGRSQLCNRYLLDGQMAYRELTFGQTAHMIGQQATAGSPRGLDDDLNKEERDQADNLMLVTCGRRRGARRAMATRRPAESAAGLPSPQRARRDRRAEPDQVAIGVDVRALV